MKKDVYPLSFRVTPQMKNRLDQLVRETGLSQATVVEFLLDMSYEHDKGRAGLPCSSTYKSFVTGGAHIHDLLKANRG